MVLALIGLLAACTGGDEAGGGIAERVATGETDGAGGAGDGAGDPQDGDDADGGGSADGGTDDATATATGDGGLRTPLPVERATELPETYWAIESGTFDLVEVLTATGAVVQRVGGWGADAAESEAPQLLTTVEADGRGSLWVDDCCEPAFGTFYKVDPGQSLDLRNGLAGAFQRTGLSPQVAPGGAIAAYAVGEIGVGVVTADGVDVVAPEAVAAAVATDAGLDAGTFFLSPVAWLDDDVVVLRFTAGNDEALYAVDVSGAPEVVAGELRFDDAVLDVDVRNDGMLVVATVDAAAADAPPVVGRVVDPDSGEQVAVFDLPPGTIDIDYDPTGTFLITVDAASTVTWIGRGETGVIGDRYVAVSW